MFFSEKTQLFEKRETFLFFSAKIVDKNIIVIINAISRIINTLFLLRDVLYKI